MSDDPKPYEAAARRWCFANSVDPDESVTHGPFVEDGATSVNLNLISSPRWTLVARSLSAHWEMTQALVAHPPAQPPPYTPSPMPLPLVVGPRRKMLITIEVGADFERRLDNQWEVEREIAADRWSWQWEPEPEKTGWKS